jgi:hypothetical protein
MIGTFVRRGMGRAAFAWLAAAGLGAGALPAQADIVKYSGVAAPAWTAMFERTSGWTGADGVYTFPMSGNDSFGSGATEGTFWIFSDTFVGDVDPNTMHRLPGTVMVHNTSATMQGDVPGDGVIDFHVRTDTDGAATSMVAPPQAGMWIWPNDGLVQGGTVYMTGLRMKTGSGGAFNFATDGVVWMTASASDAVPFLGAYTLVDAPQLYHPAPDGGTTGDMNFGSAVMPLTKVAHAPHPDGYVYVYGTLNNSSKGLVVSRVPAGQLLTGSAYRYWNGSAWVKNIAKARVMTDRLSSEFSVTPLPDGRYLLVFQLDALSKTIAVRYGASPTGPWGAPIPVYDCPEAKMTRHSYVYNAKAHPHLSTDGQLLISYHVNSFSLSENMKNADIYHPRFITVPLN